MSPKTPDQFGEIREGRKLQIMQAALELFAKEGYHSTSISKISEYAGISKGLLYNYFTSKADLLDSILTLGLNKFQDIQKEVQAGGDSREELRRFIHGGFTLIRREPEFYRLLFTVFMQPGVIDISPERYRSTAEQLTREIVYFFESKGDPSPVEKAILLGITIDGVGLQYFLSPESVDLDKMEQLIFSLFK